MTILIDQLVWGKVTVQGKTYGDIVITNKTVKPWDWNIDGTRHKPGITIKAVDHFIKAGCTDVILTEGMHRQLQVPKNTIEYLQDNGIHVLVLSSENGVPKYNDMIKNNCKVGMLLHTTC
jgi:hypothetical protein